MPAIPMVNNLDFANLFKPINVIDPTNSQDVVTLGFLTNYTRGLTDAKDACQAYAASNVALTGGATLTIDGVTISNGFRILLNGQTTPAENGIYTVSGIGSTYALTRATDADTDAKVTHGLYSMVTGGTSYANTCWLLTTPDPIVLNTTSLSFTQIDGVADVRAGAALSKSGNTLNVNVDNSSIQVDGSDQLAIHSAYPGQTSIVTVGTITTGTWNGTAIAVAYGGTGATDATTARSNLSAAKSGVNSDITSITGLTTALSVAQGGTGATSAAGARSGIGATGKYASTLTAGSTSYNVTHNLGTEDVSFNIFDTTNKVYPGAVYFKVINSNTVQFQFGATTSVDYRVIIVG